MNEFFQDGPQLRNQFDDDVLLRSYLERKLPAPMLERIVPELKRLGDRTISEIIFHARTSESDLPRHIPYDAWGKRIDHIQTSASWKALERISVEEKLISTAYQRRDGALSRLDQFARFYLYAPSSAIYTCYLAMTDGAARVIELYGDEDLKKRVYPHLTTTDPASFWTSGQWMTERTGGSDVSRTSTVARRDGAAYRLHGTKWFTSATTSQIAMALARIESDAEGSAGLSLFCVDLRDAEGSLQNIRIHRLKDKLGTRALPTAELTLEGTPARLVGGERDGVKKIASLFNITRICNALSAVAFMRRGYALAADYATRRSAFGKLLCEQPLHVETLAWLRVEFEAAFHLSFRAVELLGKEECGEATREESAILRLLTPVVKLYTARQCVASMSEVLEAFGGAGYIEDTGLPHLLRDAQVLAIWEGTTNVLSLDLLRAITREDSLRPALADLRFRLESLKTEGGEFGTSPVLALEALVSLEKSASLFTTTPRESLEAGARAFAFRLAELTAAVLMLEHAVWAERHGKGHGFTICARRWCERKLSGAEAPVTFPDVAHRDESSALVSGPLLSGASPSGKRP